MKSQAKLTGPIKNSKAAANKNPNGTAIRQQGRNKKPAARKNSSPMVAEDNKPGAIMRVKTSSS